MLYTQDIPDLTPAEELLKELGLPASYIPIGLRYIAEDDDSLLGGLIPAELTPHRLSYLTAEKFRKLFLNKKNRELALRYIRFCAAAAGVDAALLIYDTLMYGPRNVFEDKLCAEALSERMGGDTEAFILAMKTVYCCEMHNYLRWLTGGSPELCMNALEILDRYGKSGYRLSSAALCTYALDRSPLPQAGAPASETAQKAARRLLDLYADKKNFPGSNIARLAAGLAEAACFNANAKPCLDELLAVCHAVPQLAVTMGLDLERVFDVLEQFPKRMNNEYIRFISAERSLSDKPRRRERLGRLAAAYPKMFRTVLGSTKDIATAAELQDILAENDPTFDKESYDLRGIVRRRMTKLMSEGARKPAAVEDFLGGKGSYRDMYAAVNGRKITARSDNSLPPLNYYGAFGADDFLKRVFTVFMTSEVEAYYIDQHIYRNCGFRVLSDDEDKAHPDHTELSADFMLECGAPLTEVISRIGLAVEGSPTAVTEKNAAAAARSFARYPDLLAECDHRKMCVTGRIVYAKALELDAGRFGGKIAALADDSSKAVREELVRIITAHRELSGAVEELLAAKKQAKREMALSVLEMWGTEGFTEQLKAALEREKTEKLQVRMISILGAESSPAAKTDAGERIKKLMRGASKLSWLYGAPFPAVHNTDGSEAEEDYLKAIMLCYAGMDRLARNPFACELAEALDPKDLEAFAAEVFTRWYDRGAQAKTKWVLYFCAVHGGAQMCRRLTEHIREWGAYSFNMRTAIAGEAVKALAMNGSSEALMTVDSIARKFKSKSVRAAANDAMAAAADGLGITAEELADRIVPDLGFDDDLCRVFDYGRRTFSVYIRPSLELEIFCGEKKLKSMPKPGTADDPAKAPAAYEEFKEMKKLMKAAVTAQKQRLEYVLMCDRKWTAEGWRALFVKNAIMHCFAIGLIWGIYENGRLADTFRYMEDGSFTTSDGDEFELPDSAVIGLVHPLELSDELKAEWTEQLSDFEIVQPFPQLSRRVFTPTDEEKTLTRVTRFNGSEVNSLSLTGKMTRLGWYKGTAEDAGIFFYFTREDVSSRFVGANGRTAVTGYGAMLTHSGTYIGTYDTEGEEVTAEDLIFFRAGTTPNYWDKEEKGFLKCSEVSPRYFSEIVLQLTGVLGDRS